MVVCDGCSVDLVTVSLGWNAWEEGGDAYC